LQRLLRGAGVLTFRMLADVSPENQPRYDRYREQLDKQGPRPQKGDSEGWYRIDNPTAFLNLRSPADVANYNPKAESRFIVHHREKIVDWYVLAKLSAEYGLLAEEGSKTPWKLVGVGPSRDQLGRRAVSFQLDMLGGQLFRQLTSANLQKE